MASPVKLGPRAFWPPSRPLKQRYPRRRMTIAAAVRYDDGVLLFADTQQEAGALKIHGPKIGQFECPGGSISYAMAGNAAFAVSAIQKAEKKVSKAKRERVLEELENTLASEYRRVVFSHPNYKVDWNLPYWFLIAHWNADVRRISLFATEEITMHAVLTRYDCIGIGGDLAHYLLGAGWSPEIKTEREASLWAAYTLNQVKEHVPGCGGVSQFLAVRNDGTFSVPSSGTLESFAHLSFNYNFVTSRVLLAAADEDLDETRFDELVQLLGDNAKELRGFWRKLQNRKPFN